MSDDRSLDDDVVMALHALLAADESGEPLDNATLSAVMGWDLARTGACLAQAKDRSLIWGTRGPHKPGPWFSEIEVTMQGRRLLRPRPVSG